MRLIVLSALLSALIAPMARAEVTVKEYRDAKAHGGGAWDAIKLYVLGLGYGLKYANSLLNEEHLPTLYCPPSATALDADDYLAILEQELKNQAPATSTHIEVVLAVALQKTYACG